MIVREQLNNKKFNFRHFVKFYSIVMIVSMSVLVIKQICIPDIIPDDMIVETMALDIPISPTVTPEISIEPKIEKKVELVSRGDVERNNTIDIMNKKFRGKFKNKGILFEKLGKTYNVNCLLVAAIAMHETANGTSPACRNLNNPGGLMYETGGLRYFNSIDIGIETMFRCLSENYIKKGLKDIESIGKKYCPVGAKNDPTGLNKYWVPNVTEIYLELKNMEVR